MNTDTASKRRSSRKTKGQHTHLTQMYELSSSSSPTQPQEEQSPSPSSSSGSSSHETIVYRPEQHHNQKQKNSGHEEESDLSSHAESECEEESDLSSHAESECDHDEPPRSKRKFLHDIYHDVSSEDEDSEAEHEGVVEEIPDFDLETSLFFIRMIPFSTSQSTKKFQTKTNTLYNFGNAFSTEYKNYSIVNLKEVSIYVDLRDKLADFVDTGSGGTRMMAKSTSINWSGAEILLRKETPDSLDNDDEFDNELLRVPHDDENFDFKELIINHGFVTSCLTEEEEYEDDDDNNNDEGILNHIFLDIVVVTSPMRSMGGRSSGHTQHRKTQAERDKEERSKHEKLCEETEIELVLHVPVEIYSSDSDNPYSTPNYKTSFIKRVPELEKTVIRSLIDCKKVTFGCIEANARMLAYRASYYIENKDESRMQISAHSKLFIIKHTRFGTAEPLPMNDDELWEVIDSKRTTRNKRKVKLVVAFGKRLPDDDGIILSPELTSTNWDEASQRDEINDPLENKIINQTK